MNELLHRNTQSQNSIHSNLYRSSRKRVDPLTNLRPIMPGRPFCRVYIAPHVINDLYLRDQSIENQRIPLYS
jgi:hypothetical protein